MSAAPAVTATELLDRLQVTPQQLIDVLAELEGQVRRDAAEVAQRRDGGEPDVFPTVDFAAVRSGTVTVEQIRSIKSAGCVVVRSTFPRQLADDWDAELADYLATNSFRDRLFNDQPASTTGSRIWPVYWSRPQVAARQHDHMAIVRRFLNGFWQHESHSVRWFDPDRDIGYPDRVRRREPGAVAKGLAMHCDAPSSGGWRLAENQTVFARLIAAGAAGYDPWNPAHRTTLADGGVVSPVGSTVFRTFQGWTALSEMHPGDGVLAVAPLPLAAGYRLVRGFAGELGLIPGEPAEPAPRRDFGDETIASALVPIPAVSAGDTVWWHGDLFHSVGEAANRDRWGNVMYIGAAPGCPRNDAYAANALERFESGRSPVDFPPDDYEIDFVGRATVADLNPYGRAQFGLDPMVRPG